LGIEEELHGWWNKKRSEIESRLSEFKVVGKSGEKRIFEELCFCLLTPQSSALAADKAIRHLIHTSLLYEGTPEQITSIISGSGIRFGDNKGRYIVQAREKLMGEDAILSLPNLLEDDPKKARENVVDNIKGLGYKEASHFLRNIGYEGLAILDRHILRTLCEACVIDCAGSETDPHRETPEEETAWQLYTSGTTGHPKGAEITHGNIFAMMLAGTVGFGGLTPGEVGLVCMPLYHIAGAGYAMALLFSGMTLVLTRDFDPVEILRLIEQKRVNHTFFVPVMMNFLLLMPECATTDFSSLRTVLYGASPNGRVHSVAPSPVPHTRIRIARAAGPPAAANARRIGTGAWAWRRMVSLLFASLASATRR